MKKIYRFLSALCWIFQIQCQEKEFEPAIALHSKIYCTIPPKVFSISDIEKPLNFRPFEKDQTQKFSWTFRPVKSAQKSQKCFILIGYTDQDTDDAQSAAVNILNNPLFLGTATSDSTPTADTKSESDKQNKEMSEPQSTGQATPSAPIQASAKQSNEQPIVLTAQNASSANQPILLTANDAAKSKQKAGDPVILTAQDTVKTEPKVQKKEKTKVIIPEVKDRPLLLDFMVACSNDPKRKLTAQDALDIMPDGKIYGDPFNLTRYKNCQIIAKKYKEDAPAEEIKEALEQLYFAIKEPSRIFE